MNENQGTESFQVKNSTMQGKKYVSFDKCIFLKKKSFQKCIGIVAQCLRGRVHAQKQCYFETYYIFIQLFPGSIYMTMVIATERYIIVCHPFFRLSHPWSPTRYIIPVIIISVVYNIPKLWEIEVSKKSGGCVLFIKNEMSN